jgi:Cu+-exporting ATPase
MTVGGWHYQGDWVKEAFLIQNLVRSVEAGLKHPIATVFENHLPENQAFVLKSREWLAGEGVCGRVQWNSQIFDIKVGVMPELESVAPKTKSVGIKLNGVFVGWVVFEEVLREGVQPVFEHLFKKGHAISILTGDPAPASPMLCGAPVYGGLSPMDKVEWVKNCQKSGASVIFIGDGLNDAGVMECANGSIAMGNYELLTSSVAQGIVLGPSLYPLLTAYELAMTIYKTMKRSWCFALFYNLVGMGFAVCGYLHPVLAALIMAASSGWVAYRAYQSAK